MPDARWNFEINSPGQREIDALVALLEDGGLRGVSERVCLSFGRSLDPEPVAEMRAAVAPHELCTCASTTERGRVADIAIVQLMSAAIDRDPPAHVDCTVVSDAVAERGDVEEAGENVVVMTWPVEKEAEEGMKRLIAAGFHGIMTNRPDLLKAVLRERNLWIEP